MKAGTRKRRREEGREGKEREERQRQTKSLRTQAKEDVSSNSLKMK